MNIDTILCAVGPVAAGMRVFLLTSGDGSPGNEWGVISIHSSRELAEAAKAIYEQPIKRPWDDSTYTREAEIEEWEVDPELPKKYQLTWLCDACYEAMCAELRQEIEVKTIVNIFQSPCAKCGELAARFVDVPVTA
jgi:hypothetical protein